MKVRNGFVSNSSSSSFIVVASTGNTNIIEKYIFHLEKENYNSLFVVPDDYLTKGNLEFGWDEVDYTLFEDRLNFALLQACYLDGWSEETGKPNEGKYHQQIERVIKKTLKCDIFQSRITSNWCGNSESRYIEGYIDHQSCASEGENMEMFKNDEELFNFLFNNDSIIRGGNDN